MAASSGTRRGNGAGGSGWGGPAKGAGSKGPGPGAGNTHRTVAEIMAAADARQTAANAWLAILSDPQHPKHAEMVAKAAERMDGAPVQRMEHAGQGAFVLMGEPEAESADEWQEQHARK